MRAIGILVLFVIGCGVVESSEPTRADVSADVDAKPADVDSFELKSCAPMECDLLIGDSCPVCGTPELTCACYNLKRDGSDEIGVPCAPPVGSLTCH